VRDGSGPNEYARDRTNVYNDSTSAPTAKGHTRTSATARTARATFTGFGLDAARSAKTCSQPVKGVSFNPLCQSLGLCGLALGTYHPSEAP